MKAKFEFDTDEEYKAYLRIYFSGLAMQTNKPPSYFVGDNETEKSFQDWAQKCVKMADSLLSELEKPTT